MRSHSSSLEEDLHQGIREPDIEPLMDELVGNTVIVMIEFNVIIDIDPGDFPIGIDVTLNRQGFEGRSFQGFKEELSGSFQFLEGAVI